MPLTFCSGFIRKALKLRNGRNQMSGSSCRAWSCLVNERSVRGSDLVEMVSCWANRTIGLIIDCFLDLLRLVLGISALEGRLFRSFFFLHAASTASTPIILGIGSRIAVSR